MSNKQPIRVSHQLILIFFILPIEFRAPSKYEQEESDQEEFDEGELGEVVAQLTLQS